MNPKNRSFAPIAILVGMLGLGSVAIAGLTLNLANWSWGN